MYVPADDIDYYMKTGKLPKALAANAADADLNGICVPQRQDDGSYKDAQGAVMTRADMADYFQRLRAAQAAANIPAPPLSLMRLCKMMMIMQLKKVLLLLFFLLVVVLLSKNLNLVELRQELMLLHTKLHN